MLVEHRPDFKQALFTLQQLKQKEGPFQASTNSQKSPMGTEFLFMVELARFMVDSLLL